MTNAPFDTMRPKRDYLLGALVIGMLLGAVCLGVDEARRGRHPPAGSSAPQVSLRKLNGELISVSQYRGRVLMIDFWATWCPPCVEEMPRLVALAKEFESKGLSFIAANRDDPDDAEALIGVFMQQRVPDLEPFVALADDRAAAHFGIQALPTLVFIDRHGNLLSQHVGAASEEALRRFIEGALHSP